MYLIDIAAAFAITCVVAIVGAFVFLVMSSGFLRLRFGVVLAGFITTAGFTLMAGTVDGNGDWHFEGHAPSAVLGSALASAALLVTAIRLRRS